MQCRSLWLTPGLSVEHLLERRNKYFSFIFSSQVRNCTASFRLFEMARLLDMGSMLLLLCLLFVIVLLLFPIVLVCFWWVVCFNLVCDLLIVVSSYIALLIMFRFPREVVKKPSYSRCRECSAVCDGCGMADLLYDDWFRCNECDDFDMCAGCFKYGTHTGSHKFTDMSVFVRGAEESNSELMYKDLVVNGVCPNGEKRFLLDMKCHIRGRCADNTDSETTQPSQSTTTNAAVVRHVRMNPEYAEKIEGRNTCDGCSKRSLAKTNWFRCNTCNDYDLCADCFKSSQHEASHSFTDMSTFTENVVACTIQPSMMYPFMMLPFFCANETCKKRLYPGDWLRCNCCPNTNCCRECFFRFSTEHRDGKHCFTAMSDAFFDGRTFPKIEDRPFSYRGDNIRCCQCSSKCSDNYFHCNNCSSYDLCAMCILGNRWSTHAPHAQKSFTHVIVIPSADNETNSGMSRTGRSNLDSFTTRDQDDNKCLVCYTSKPVIACDPCGHLAMCEPCSLRFKCTKKNCPVCRMEYSKLLKGLFLFIYLLLFEYTAMVSAPLVHLSEQLSIFPPDPLLRNFGFTLSSGLSMVYSVAISREVASGDVNHVGNGRSVNNLSYVSAFTLGVFRRVLLLFSACVFTVFFRWSHLSLFFFFHPSFFPPSCFFGLNWILSRYEWVIAGASAMFPIRIGLNLQETNKNVLHAEPTDAMESILAPVETPSSDEDEIQSGTAEPYGIVEECFPMKSYPHCPIFIPSKGRSDVDKFGTLANLVKDMVPFTVVVERDDAEPYSCLLDSLVFRYFGQRHMVYAATQDRDADHTPASSVAPASPSPRSCACCGGAIDGSYAAVLSRHYHHGYVFTPSAQSIQLKDRERRSPSFELETVEQVRQLFAVEVLPEENKGISFARNYILHVLAPRAMMESLVDESGHLEELDILSGAHQQGLRETVLRRWGIDEETLNAIVKKRQLLSEKQATPRLHGLVGYYWVLDDDIHSFVAGRGSEKNTLLSPREMMCEVERRMLKMEKNCTRKAAALDPTGSIFTCKEEALLNNYMSPGQPLGNIINTDTFEHFDKTAILSLEYSRYTFLDAYSDNAIAVNSYNNIACLFRYDLLHIPTTKTVQFFPTNASGVRSVGETLVGYAGHMMWYRFAVREDYDFTLQLIARGFYTIRFRNIGFDVPQMTKLRGGMTDYYKNCQTDILDQNKRFVVQWPSISQRCLKGKNSTRREDIRIRWDLLHPAKARYPGAYLYLRELLPQIAPINPEKLQEELNSIAATEAKAKVECGTTLPAKDAVGPPEERVPPLREENVTKRFRIEGAPSTEEIKKTVVDSLSSSSAGQDVVATSEPEVSGKSTVPSRPLRKEWKGFTVESWRDVVPSEAKAFGLTPIPSEQLRVGRQVAVIPPNFADKPSVVVALLVDATPTVAKHSALCARYPNQEEEVTEWSAVAQQVRGMRILTTVYCYEVPSEPLEVIAARIDALYLPLRSITCAGTRRHRRRTLSLYLNFFLKVLLLVEYWVFFFAVSLYNRYDSFFLLLHFLFVVSCCGSGKNEDVDATANRYFERFEEKATAEERKGSATTLVNEYYDLVTDFYEFGWGLNFHFAPRYAEETFNESIARHEHFLAARGGFKDGDRIADIGCGVGGPARNMIRLTHCNVVGVNNNEYQIKRSRYHDARLGFTNKMDYCKTDFCHMTLPDNAMDGAYAIEATCHAADKVQCYREILRVLKPGAYFVVYEWCMTDRYDPTNEVHRRIKHGIELGDGLPDMESCDKAVEAMKAAGFEVDESFDMIEKYREGPYKQIPWYQPLQGNYSSVKGVRATPVGRIATHFMCRSLELLRIAPKGTYKATEILEEAARNLVLGGETGIFTPAFYMRGRKPLHATKHIHQHNMVSDDSKLLQLDLCALPARYPTVLVVNWWDFGSPLEEHLRLIHTVSHGAYDLINTNKSLKGASALLLSDIHFLCSHSPQLDAVWREVDEPGKTSLPLLSGQKQKGTKENESNTEIETIHVNVFCSTGLSTMFIGFTFYGSCSPREGGHHPIPHLTHWRQPLFQQCRRENAPSSCIFPNKCLINQQLYDTQIFFLLRKV
eukprot:gene5160-3709_t